jgi:hypothetical protein
MTLGALRRLRDRHRRLGESRSRIERSARSHVETTLRTASRLEFAAINREALRHSGETLSRARRVRDGIAAPVIAHLELQPLVGRPHADDRVSGTGVLDGVRQPLLDEAVRDQVEPR